MHIDSMIMRIKSGIIFVAAGYLGLVVLCVHLVQSAGSTEVGALTFDVVHNRCNAGFVDTIATMLNLQISMYVLKGLFDNGAAFAVSFSCLSVILYKLQPVRFVAGCVFCILNRIASWKRILRYCVVPGIFCMLALINAYLCQPVGPFVFARWILVEAPLTLYFLAGLLSVVMWQQMMRLAKKPGVSILKFSIRTLGLLLFFEVLGGFWPDMSNPIGQFVLSCVHDNSGLCTFGIPDYYSNVPASPLVWDTIAFLFMLLAAGATQLGTFRLVLNTVRFRGRFFAPNLFTTKFVLSVTLAALMLSANLSIIGFMLPAFCEAYKLTNLPQSWTSSSIFYNYVLAVVVIHYTSKKYRSAYVPALFYASTCPFFLQY